MNPEKRNTYLLWSRTSVDDWKALIGALGMTGACGTPLKYTVSELHVHYIGTSQNQFSQPCSFPFGILNSSFSGAAYEIKDQQTIDQFQKSPGRSFSENEQKPYL